MTRPSKRPVPIRWPYLLESEPGTFMRTLDATYAQLLSAKHVEMHATAPYNIQHDRVTMLKALLRNLGPYMKERPQITLRVAIEELGERFEVGSDA